MKKIIIVFGALIASSSTYADTPPQCVERLGSIIKCFSVQASYYVDLCGMASHVERLEFENELLARASRQEPIEPPQTKPPQTKPHQTTAYCVDDAKKHLKQFYDAVVKQYAKKPAVQKAAKKSMMSVYAILDNLPASRQLHDNLKESLAEMEIESQ